MRRCFGEYNAERDECLSCSYTSYCKRVVVGSCSSYLKGYSPHAVECKICLAMFDEGRQCKEALAGAVDVKRGVGVKGKGMTQWAFERLKEGCYADEFIREFEQKFGRKETASFYAYEFRKRGYDVVKEKRDGRVWYKLVLKEEGGGV